MSTRPLIVAAVITLAGCSTRQPAPDFPLDEFVPAKVETEPARPLEIVEIPKPIPFPNQLKPLPELSVPASPVTPKQSVSEANAAARVEPTPSGFINAIQVWPYSPAALYQVYASPGQTTDLVFQPGEQLIDVSISDPVRWIVGDTLSGSGATQQVHLIVKPIRTDLHANLIVTTDRRTYYVELKSAPETWMAAVSWQYPGDRLQQLKLANEKREAALPIAVGVQLEQLRFRYDISGDTVSWRPLRAFDDGRKVYIQFPEGIGQGEMPPLFVIGAEGTAEIVNYRVRAPYYIVDRLFGAAELRLGGKNAKVVRIMRNDVKASRRKRARR